MENGGRQRFLEPHEMQRLLEAPNLKSLTGLPGRCVLQLMYESGLRIGEVLALKPRDVVLEDKRVEVARGKGNKLRTVYFRSDPLPCMNDKITTSITMHRK